MVNPLNSHRRARLAVAGAVTAIGLTAGAAGIAWASSTSAPAEIGWGTVAESTDSGTTTAADGQDCPNRGQSSGPGSGSADDATPPSQGGDL